MMTKFIQKEYMGPGKIFALSGPAGIGKSTVCAPLLEHFKHLKKITTVTTRPPRPGEIDGIDYHFINEVTFLKYIAEDRFLEYATVHKKHFYGTPIVPVLSNIQHGTDLLLVIDMQGVARIRKNFRHLVGNMTTIFMMPEHLGILEERMKIRGTESPDDIAKRLESAKREMKFSETYDYVIVSGSKEEDFTSITTIFNKHSNTNKHSDGIKTSSTKNSNSKEFYLYPNGLTRAEAV